MNGKNLVFRHPGTLLSVTTNCHEALTKLWGLGFDYIWVDAVCINQGDSPERNAQVAMMSKIYSSAKRVVVFLGEKSNDSDLAMEYLMSHKFAEGSSSAFPQRTRMAVTSLFRRPWFGRIWVLQEVGAARECWVVCGTKLMSLFNFHAFHMHNIERYDPLEEFPYPVRSYTDYRGLMKGRGWSAKKLLLHLLCATRHCGATDPRDKYFALLSMLNDQRSESLTADYSKETSEVYTDLAVYILENIGLSLLCAMQGERVISNLPSWVPDWSVDCGRACSVLGNNVLRFEAGGNPELMRAEMLKPVDRSPMLELKLVGFELGTIVQLGTNYDRNQPNFKQAARTWQQFYCLQGGSIHASDEQQASRLQGFFRTVSFGYAFELRDVISWAPESEGNNTPEFRAQRVQISESYRAGISEDTQFDDYRSREYSRKVREVMHKRRLFRTDRDCGIGPEEAKIHDVLCIFLGAPTPFLVRRFGTYCTLIGECYVDGMMYGDMIPTAFDYESPETHQSLVLVEFILR